ncbi:uncharacterized protein BXZ73DRAFT_97735 [Epithele typhae]|uniref:uncharacterized protein n=1 Tax=Epithele typhae TaxID=378194 RepID=UPI00200729E0|nr:uncharacterized protein BXZ73DRAFT_97735 [Epithele typhae]KAH9942322.1 hypothetical protein BXZ73DRAFT_97735 [Epithele typhae]
MNFFDTYELPGTTTPPANPQPSQSLNEEVEQVVGQLSRFWGGFRKQSQTALETARKDLGSVVQQAQKELTKLTADGLATPTASAVPDSGASATEQAASLPSEAREAAASASPSTPTASPEKEKEKETETATADRSPEGAASPSAPSAAQTQSLLSRLQASLPPALQQQQAQLAETFRETLHTAQARAEAAGAQLDLQQLRGTVLAELQRVQGAAPGALQEAQQRAEGLLKGAGEFLKDAVKVVPPEEGDSYAGLIWDGTDVWMLPGTVAAASVETAGKDKGKGKEREKEVGGSGRPSVDTLRAVATRAESMLKQLRHDPEVIKADPTEDGNVREMHATWLATEAASEDRGLGTSAWENKVARAFADPVDGDALKATMDALVPEHLTADEFWTRYFFRVYQVEREEAQRRALIQGTNDKEEEFSWEDDDDETLSPPTKPETARAAPKEVAKSSAPSAGLLTADGKAKGPASGTTSPAKQRRQLRCGFIASQSKRDC